MIPKTLCRSFATSRTYQKAHRRPQYYITDMDTEESENDDGEEYETNDNRTPQSFSLYNALNGCNIEDIIINSTQLVAFHVSNHNLQETADNPDRIEENVLLTPPEHSSNSTSFEVSDSDNCTYENDSSQQSPIALRGNATKQLTSSPVVPTPTPDGPTLTYSDGPRRSKRRHRKPRDSPFKCTRLHRIARPARPARSGRSSRTVPTARTHRAARNIGRRAWCRLVPGRTPLHLAIHMDAVELVEMLVGAGADVNAPDERGRSPLQLATAHQNMQIVRALLGSGARGAAARRRGSGRTKNDAVTAAEI